MAQHRNYSHNQDIDYADETRKNYGQFSYCPFSHDGSSEEEQERKALEKKEENDALLRLQVQLIKSSITMVNKTTNLNELTFLEAFVKLPRWDHRRFQMSDSQKFGSYGAGGYLANHIELSKEMTFQKWKSSFNSENGYEFAMFSFTSGATCPLSLQENYAQWLYIYGLWAHGLIEGLQTITPDAVSQSTLLKWVKSFVTPGPENIWKISDDPAKIAYYSEAIHYINGISAIVSAVWLNSYNASQGKVASDLPISDEAFWQGHVPEHIKTVDDIMEFAICMFDYLQMAEQNPGLMVQEPWGQNRSLVHPKMTLITDYWKGTAAIDYLLDKLEIMRISMKDYLKARIQTDLRLLESLSATFSGEILSYFTKIDQSKEEMLDQASRIVNEDDQVKVAKIAKSLQASVAAVLVVHSDLKKRVVAYDDNLTSTTYATYRLIDLFKAKKSESDAEESDTVDNYQAKIAQTRKLVSDTLYHAEVKAHEGSTLIEKLQTITDNVEALLDDSEEEECEEDSWDELEEGSGKSSREDSEQDL